MKREVRGKQPLLRLHLVFLLSHRRPGSHLRSSAKYSTADQDSLRSPRSLCRLALHPTPHLSLFPPSVFISRLRTSQRSNLVHNLVEP